MTSLRSGVKFGCEEKNKKFVNNIIQRQVKAGGGTEAQKLQFKKLIK